MSKYLYGASVHGIQEYIFATNELKSIVGASEIIKNIAKTIDENYKENIIINAAGNIKLIFDEKSEFEDLVKNFVKKTKQKAFGLNISQAVVSFENGKLKEAFSELENNLNIQKNRADIPLDMSINILKNAPKSAKPIVENEKDRATLQKENANISTSSMPKNRKNKTAVIHADGNGLGAMIAAMSKNLKSDAEVKKAYKDFSTNLEIATQNAYTLAKDGIKESEIREIILGGDDLTVVCSANIALEFTNKYLAAFESQTKEIFKNEGLNACAGIAYANHKYPFHYAVNLAESLCSYAKKHSRKIKSDESLKIMPSSLMFHNIQSSNFSDFQEYIEKELTIKNKKESISLNYGPYFTTPQKGYSTITNFIFLAKALMLKGSPMSRYREWLTILGQDSVQASERLKRIDMMMDLKEKIYRKKSLEKSLENFNKDIKTDELLFQRDQQVFTPIHDIDTHLSVIDYESKEESSDEV